MSTCNGLVVGKFAPLHKGHDYLIRTALDTVDRLTIIHYGSVEVGVDCNKTDSKLRELYPNAEVINTYNLYAGYVPKNEAPEVDHRFFVAKIIAENCEIPDFVFSSENYGQPFADFLSGFFSSSMNAPLQIRHICVDLQRKTFPVSATMIRTDLVKFKDWIM